MSFVASAGAINPSLRRTRRVYCSPFYKTSSGLQIKSAQGYLSIQRRAVYKTSSALYLDPAQGCSLNPLAVLINNPEA